MISDGVLFLGSIVIAFGAWMAWRPLGVIVAGLLIVFWGVFFEYYRLQRKLKKRVTDAGDTGSA